jgi:outer membrane lipoprotein-sorting protein
MPFRILALAGIAMFGQAAGAQTLADILATMDKEAAGFRDLTAQVAKTSHTVVLNDTSTETGQLWIKRSGPRKVEMRIAFAGANERQLSFHGNAGEIYYPKIRTVQIYDLGKSRSLVDQFLLLGFGTSGKELAKAYDIRLVGQEVAGGQKTNRLELTPRSEELRKHITKIDLWVPPDAGHPVQQRFLRPGGDFELFAYSDMRLNPNLPDASFRLELPKDVKREFPQK